MTIPYIPNTLFGGVPQWANQPPQQTGTDTFWNRLTNYMQQQAQQAAQPSGAPNWWSSMTQRAQQAAQAKQAGLPYQSAFYPTPTPRPASPFRVPTVSQFNAQAFPILNVANNVANIPATQQAIAAAQARGAQAYPYTFAGVTASMAERDRLMQQNTRPVNTYPYTFAGVTGDMAAQAAAAQAANAAIPPGYGTGGGYGGGYGSPSYPSYPSTPGTPGVDKWMYGMINWRVAGV